MYRRVATISNAIGRHQSTSASHPVKFTPGRITEPLGQGKVIPLKYDYPRPQYIEPNYVKQFFAVNFWVWHNYLQKTIPIAIFLWGMHGGFTGHLPPDPHELFN